MLFWIIVVTGLAIVIGLLRLALLGLDGILLAIRNMPYHRQQRRMQREYERQHPLPRAYTKFGRS